MLEDRDLRDIRNIVSEEIYSALRNQLPKIIGDVVSESELKRALDGLEDRIVKRLS